MSYKMHVDTLSHPLCNIVQDIQWLVKPVGALLDKIQGTRPETRLTLKGASMGTNIFQYASYHKAEDFVTETDDVLLVDFMTNQKNKWIWHYADVRNSVMLSQSVIAAYSKTVANDGHYTEDPEWLTYLRTFNSSDLCPYFSQSQS